MAALTLIFLPAREQRDDDPGDSHGGDEEGEGEGVEKGVVDRWGEADEGAVAGD